MTRRTVALAFAALAMTLIAGYFVKNLCTTHAWDGFQYRSSCYNDIYSLYSFRGLEHEPVPYIHGSGELDDATDENGNTVERGDLEYPAGTGLLIAAAALLASDGLAFFRLTSGALALCAAAALAALAWISVDRRRLFYLALAPAVALYAFHNWDLLAVAALCAGLALFARGRDGWAGAAIGFGAAAKVFPGVALPALVVARFRRRGEVPWMMIAAAAAVFLLVNLPFMLINAKGWFMPWDFQSTRFPNFETHWFMIYRHLGDRDTGSFWWTVYPRLSSVLSLVAFGFGAIALLRAEVKRQVFRPYVAAFGMMLLFLLTGKIYSPQFALWLVPFFVLVKMPLRTFIAFVVTDAAAWAAVSYFFLDDGDASRMVLLEVAVWVRYAVLAWILVVSRRAEENVLTPRDTTPVPALP